MDKPTQQQTSQGSPVGFSTQPPSDEMVHRVSTAFHVALSKLVETNGNVERVVQTGEAFGRGLFAEFLSNETDEWTLQQWIDSVMEHILYPMGHLFTTAEMTSDHARSLMIQSSLDDSSDESHVASLFTYGFLRGLLLSAFPKGELLMGSTMALGDPVTEFTFKTTSSYTDRYERSRVKNMFTTTKKL